MNFQEMRLKAIDRLYDEKIGKLYGDFEIKCAQMVRARRFKEAEELLDLITYAAKGMECERCEEKMWVLNKKD